MSNTEVTGMLNDLIATCRESRELYRAAAENISNSEFRRLFNIFSQQRAQFISELQAEVHRLGGELSGPDIHPETLSSNWWNRKSRFYRADEVSIISDCQDAEESAVNHYQEALKADLPLDVQYVIKRQYMDIKDAYDRIRILQRAA
jgi:uncharacterized protein (TIGR02284 family)